MEFVRFFQYLGTHVPALGAFLVCMVVVAFLCFVFYKLGIRTANNRWRWDVEHMPAVIGQGIRESKDREIAVLRKHISWLKERFQALRPAVEASHDLLDRVAGGPE